MPPRPARIGAAIRQLKGNLHFSNDLATLTKILMVLSHRGFMLRLRVGI
jgi:hypothetical protein